VIYQLSSYFSYDSVFDFQRLVWLIIDLLNINATFPHQQYSFEEESSICCSFHSIDYEQCSSHFKDEQCESHFIKFIGLWRGMKLHQIKRLKNCNLANGGQCPKMVKIRHVQRMIFFKVYLIMQPLEFNE
jgi:hypothetical protein